MSNYLIFLRKEITENLRTKRLLVLACVFISFAMLSPLMARFMGEIFAALMPADDEASQAIIEMLSNVHWTESFAQLYGNFTQIGIFAMIFMYMSSIQREVKTATASLMFSKGLGRTAFVLAKFSAASIVLFIVVAAAIAVNYAYTVLLFEDIGYMSDIVFGGVSFFVGTVAMLAVVLLCSAVTKGAPASAGLSIGAYFAFFILGALPRINVVSPTGLFNAALTLTFGNTHENLLLTFASSLLIVAISLFAAVRALARAEG